MNQKTFAQIDWEMTDEYYQENQESPELKLEDFMDEGDCVLSEITKNTTSETPEQMLLKKTIEDVHQVLSLAQTGKTIAEIAEQLKLEPQYIYDIQVTAQGFREDDETAVAHLMLMK